MNVAVLSRGTWLFDWNQRIRNYGKSCLTPFVRIRPFVPVGFPAAWREIQRLVSNGINYSQCDGVSRFGQSKCVQRGSTQRERAYGHNRGNRSVKG